MEVHQHPTRPAQYVGRKATHRAVGRTHLFDKLDVKVVGQIALVLERV